MTNQKAWGRDEMMVLAAFSYCLGRQTYIVSDCVEWLIANWENFSENTRWLIRRDLEAAFELDHEERLMRGGRCRYLGSDMDKAEWEKVRKLWEGEK